MAQLPLLAGASAPAPSAVHPALLQAAPTTIPSSASIPSSAAIPSSAPRPNHTRRSQLRSEAAYEELLPELLALPAERLLPVTVDVMSAITTVSDALPDLMELCSELEPPESEQRPRHEPLLRLEQLEQLEQYVLALGHAHLLYCGSCSPDLDVALLAAELSKLRDAMLAHAEALATEGLLDGQRLKRIALGSALHCAHRALAGDVIALCAIFRAHWLQLEHRTRYSLEEQFRLVRLALDLMAALDAREPGPRSAAESRALRQRAFTLFASAYEGVRAAVRCLRTGAGDAELWAPPLPGERPRRSRPLTPQQPPAPGAAAPPPAAHAASPARSRPAETPG